MSQHTPVNPNLPSIHPEAADAVALTVRKGAGKTWQVVRGDEVIKGEMTNSEAWRFIDIAQRQPVNRSQEVGDWIFRQQAGRGA